MANPTTQQQQPQQATGMGGSGSPTTASLLNGQPGITPGMTEEQKREASEKASRTLQDYLSNIQQSGMVGALSKLFGVGQEQDPAKAAAKAIISSAVNLSSQVDVHDAAKNPNLKYWDGNPETRIHNVKEKFTEMFNEGRLKFSNDPAENKTKFDEFKKSLDGLNTQKDAGAVMAAVTKELEDRGAHFDIDMTPKKPTPSPRDPSVAAGGVTVKADQMGALGLAGHATLYDNKHAVIGSGGATTIAETLGAQPGDPIQMQVERSSSGYVSGYYISKADKPNEGVYLDVDAVDLTRMDPKLKDELFKPAPAAPAPAPEGPQVTAENRPVVGAPGVGGPS